MECDHQKTRLRLREIAGGRTVNDYQCLVCGHKVGDSVKKNPEITEPWDDVLAEQWQRQEEVEREVRRKEAEQHRAPAFATGSAPGKSVPATARAAF